MKTLFCLMILAISLNAAGKKTPEKPPSIPKDAVQLEPGIYRHTDAKGKKWIYRVTPFAVVKLEDKPKDEAAIPGPQGPKLEEQITAAADGEYVRFSRPGPFGVYKWRRKKTELDEVEQKVWNRELEKNSKKQGQE
jgi:hypothetical protein